ncbi:hypothetical protein [Actinoalloteichus fjordicus]|uniref:Uncharacterized protein n=1 Tax=Actinoalloteichus fjordicus TaxID=1612552 RepID=A0AAC9PSQ4_9PSEU|nr:hypothetical protein [Actinoalloteichus fjordicus]APU15799.1 hypothetical protein UA74_18855 [Actinoalloteichus fjordicus]
MNNSPARRLPVGLVGAWALLTGPTGNPVHSMVVAGCALGGGVGALLLAPPDWTSWQLMLAVVLAVDLIGGLAAGALASGGSDRRWGRTTSARLLVIGAHVVHPALAVLLFSARWEWGLLLFLTMAGAVLLLPRVPADLAVAVALAATTIALTLASTAFGGPPDGLTWVAVAYLLKLVVAGVVGRGAADAGPGPSAGSRRKSAVG